jgi:general secretion pathway protein I
VFACEKIKITNKKASGFLLVEVLVAVAILATALVAVFQLQSQSVSMASDARFSTSAALLAQSKMAEAESGKSFSGMNQEGDFGDDYPQYSWRVEISDTKIAKFKKIEVTVSNKDMPRGGTYKLVLYKEAGG